MQGNVANYPFKDQWKGICYIVQLRWLVVSWHVVLSFICYIVQLRWTKLLKRGRRSWIILCEKKVRVMVTYYPPQYNGCQETFCYQGASYTHTQTPLHTSSQLFTTTWQPQIIWLIQVHGKRQALKAIGTDRLPVQTSVLTEVGYSLQWLTWAARKLHHTAAYPN